MCQDVINAALPTPWEYWTQRSGFLRSFFELLKGSGIAKVMARIPYASSLGAQLETFSIDYANARIAVGVLGFYWTEYGCGSQLVRAHKILVGFGGDGGDDAGTKKCQDENWEISFNGGQMWGASSCPCVTANTNPRGIAVKTLAALVFLFGVRAGIAPAQAPSAHDPLAAPTNTMLCRLTRGDSAQLVLYVVAPSDSGLSRDITAVFDTAGTPLLMTVFSPERRAAGVIWTLAIGVQFGSESRGLQAVLEGAPDDPSGDSASGHELSRQMMSDSAIARARALAVGLWAHRCTLRP